LGVETATVNPLLDISFADGSTATFTYRFNEEAIATPFRIRPGYAIAVGRYRFEDGEASFATSRARRISLNGGYRFGEFWNGNQQGFTAGGRLRFHAKLATTVHFSRNMVDLPGVTFDTNLLSLRVDGSFTTRMFLNAFIQYNSVNREVLSNVRFNFMHHPLSDLFIVYDETRSSNGTLPPSRALTLKLTHLLSF
jgi:hypothetical protein